MKWYPKRLYHETPSWVRSGSVFHIRIRCHQKNKTPLTDYSLGIQILDSVIYYQEKGNWYCRLFVLMPDHLHALLSFNPEKNMSEWIGIWKKYHHRNNYIKWQENYFDHRIRNDKELELKSTYIRHNPVVKGLCTIPELWPWTLEY